MLYQKVLKRQILLKALHECFDSLIKPFLKEVLTFLTWDISPKMCFVNPNKFELGIPQNLRACLKPYRVLEIVNSTRF
jgi:hypothetical protein